MQKQTILALLILATTATSNLFSSAALTRARSSFSAICKEIITGKKRSPLIDIPEEERSIAGQCTLCGEELTLLRGTRLACLSHMPTIEPIELHLAHYACHMEKLFEHNPLCFCGEKLIRADYTIDMALSHALAVDDMLLAKALRSVGAVNELTASPTSVTHNVCQPMCASDETADFSMHVSCALSACDLDDY